MVYLDGNKNVLAQSFTKPLSNSFSKYFLSAAGENLGNMAANDAELDTVSTASALFAS